MEDEVGIREHFELIDLMTVNRNDGSDTTNNSEQNHRRKAQV
jgi:hypothetical protein